MTETKLFGPFANTYWVVPGAFLAGGHPALGGTGHWPVSSGNLPDEMVVTLENASAAFLAWTPSSVPFGRLPNGTGRLPVLPSPPPHG